MIWNSKAAALQNRPDLSSLAVPAVAKGQTEVGFECDNIKQLIPPRPQIYLLPFLSPSRAISTPLYKVNPYSHLSRR